MNRQWIMTAALALYAGAALSIEGQTTTQAPRSLADVQSIALQQVSALRQAEIDEAMATEDLRQAQASLLPRARSASTITYNSPARPPTSTSDPSFIASNSLHEYQELLGVTGELNFGVTAAIRRARAMLRAARAGTDIARRSFLRGVSETYYGAALATARRRAAETSLAAAEDFERVTNLNFQAGEVPEIDVIRARLQTAQRRDDVDQATQAEVIANATLDTLLGSGVTAAPNIEPLPQTIDTRDIQSLTSEGVKRRPEFVQLEAQLQAARADIGVARADRLPRITYSVDEGFDTSSLSADQIRQHRGILATANIDVPLFDWGLTASRQRQAELRAEGVLVQQQLMIRDLYLQFATARIEATTAAARVENDRRALAGAERNLTISIARYRAGEGLITEVTDAQTQLATQRLNLQQALYDYQIARAHLLEAVGR